MNLSNVPRKYLLGIILVMVAALLTITIINPGSLGFKDPTDYDAQRKLAQQQAEQYQALLDSVQPDYQASQQLLKKIASEDLVRQEVESSLNVSQKVVVPTVLNSELTLTSRNSRPEVVDYVNKLGSMISNYNNEVQPHVAQTFTDGTNPSDVNAALARTKSLAQSIRGLAVPSDAVEMHKAYIVAYDTYGSFLNTASQYAAGSNLEPWASIYGQYQVIDNRLAVANTELKKLTNKYALNVPLETDFAVGHDHALVKVAQAQLAVVDVKAVVEVGIRAGLARAFAKFAITMLDKVVAHIEKNFAIASQLYYSQELGRYYSIEYMKKFVNDPLDQDIIQKFLPQYFCVNASKKELKQIFTAKAIANQGTDIIIDPNDPDYINKLARLGGDERNYGDWWEDYYTTLAATTQQEADSAATKEVLSPGLKSGRDLISGEINKTMSSIFHVEEAAITGTINLGTSNSDNLIGEMVAGVVENLVNKFVFTAIGSGSTNGGLGVLAESDVCLRTPKIKPVTPLPSSEQTATPQTTPTPQGSTGNEGPG